MNGWHSALYSRAKDLPDISTILNLTPRELSDDEIGAKMMAFLQRTKSNP